MGSQLTTKVTKSLLKSRIFHAQNKTLLNLRGLIKVGKNNKKKQEKTVIKIEKNTIIKSHHFQVW